MCGRYFRRSEKQQIAERFHASNLGDFPLAPDYNVAPSTFQPIIRESRDDASVRELILARWGLIPHFAKSLADFKGLATINAKAESVMTSSTFRVPFERRRCLVPLDGFYEWQLLGGPNTAKKNAKKQPFAFTLRDGEPFALAGLWDAWKEPKPKAVSVHAPDTWLQSFSILTTEANELMSTVHSRMPVILHERDWARWLDRTESDQPPIDLLRPYDSDAMRMTACDPAIGNVRNNGPHLLEPPAPPAEGVPASLLNSA
jgi:putative SOS response-associated peptidase YedK